MMSVGYVLYLSTIVIFGGAAALALAWAISSGQMNHVSRGATVIFDADEPIGEMTDCVLNKPRTNVERTPRSSVTEEITDRALREIK
jgi:hypothetical protein